MLRGFPGRSEGLHCPFNIGEYKLAGAPLAIVSYPEWTPGGAIVSLVVRYLTVLVIQPVIRFPFPLAAYRLCL